MAEEGWSRRDFGAAAVLLAAVVGLPAVVATMSFEQPSEQPTRRQREMMRDVSQLVLPRTTTPGAGEVGVGDFVLLALAHGLNGTRKPVGAEGMPPLVRQHRRRDSSLRYADWLEAELDQAANGNWIAKPDSLRTAVLARLDADSFAGPGNHPWKAVKSLILLGYYTSQVGGAEELRYEHTPGRFDPKVPLVPGEAAYSSDWTGVEFG